MATISLLGDTTATAAFVDSENYIILCKYTATKTGNVTEFKMRAVGSGNAKVAMYADSGGEPGALLNEVGSTAITASVNTIVFPITPVVKNTVYWLGFIIDTAAIMNYDNTGGMRRYKAGTSFPSPAGTGYTSTNDRSPVAGWGIAASGGGFLLNFV